MYLNEKYLWFTLCNKLFYPVTETKMSLLSRICRNIKLAFNWRDWLWFEKKNYYIAVEAGHNIELTWIEWGALSPVACRLPSSNQLTWQHSICACLRSPSPRYPVESACHVPSLVIPQLTGTESQVPTEEMCLEWQVATELLIRKGRSSISFLKLTAFTLSRKPVSSCRKALQATFSSSLRVRSYWRSLKSWHSWGQWIHPP